MFDLPRQRRAPGPVVTSLHWTDKECRSLPPPKLRGHATILRMLLTEKGVCRLVQCPSNSVRYGRNRDANSQCDRGRPARDPANLQRGHSQLDGNLCGRASAAGRPRELVSYPAGTTISHPCRDRHEWYCRHFVVW